MGGARSRTRASLVLAAAMVAGLAQAVPSVADHPVGYGEPPSVHDGDTVCVDDPTGDVVRMDPDTAQPSGFADEPRLDMVELCVDWHGDISLSFTLAEAADPADLPSPVDFNWTVWHGDFGQLVTAMPNSGEPGGPFAETFSSNGTICRQQLVREGATWRTGGFPPSCFDRPDQVQVSVQVRGGDLADDGPHPAMPSQEPAACPTGPDDAPRARNRNDWRAALNVYRAQAGLPPVVAHEPWTEGQRLHLAYMRNHPDETQDFGAHVELESHADYTEAGYQAAQSSNITYLVTDAVQAIEDWMQAPFHALGNLSPTLYAAAYAEEDGTAMLDVGRGNGFVPECVTYPVLWPGDGARVSVTTHFGEWPDPLTSCPGYGPLAGTPIIVQPDPDTHPAPVEVGATDLEVDGHDVEHCVITGATYRNPSSFDREYGRGILGNAVVIIPRHPLARGETYSVSVTVDGAQVDWSFDVTPRVRRLEGENRFATAAAIAADAFPQGAPTVYVATGRSFPDALAGAAAAARDGAAVLLTEPGFLHPAAEQALRDLSPERVIVLGGTSAVSAGTFDAIARATGLTPTRLSGPDRYATAAAIARTFTGTGGTVYLATGTNFPDALAGTAAAGAIGAPMVLTDPLSLPDVVRDVLVDLEPDRVVILGGTGAIGQAVEDEVARATGARIHRIAGANRYDTAARIAAESFDWPASAVYLATGTNFPDALAGAAVAGPQQAAILLATPAQAPVETIEATYRLGPTRLVVLGGDAAVAGTAVQQLLLGLTLLAM